MKCTEVSQFLPVNPRLPFGTSLSVICKNGTLHPGLRDLFLKAYLNTTDQSYNEEDTTYDNYIQKILSFGPNGQGTVDDRLSLKQHVENGHFIISLKYPPGAPIWVLRHFLGRLPKALLCEYDKKFTNSTKHSWLDLANECRNAIKLATSEGHCLDKIKMKLAAILIQLEKGNYLVLSALMGLIRNLAAGNVMNSRLNKRVVFTLTCYFTQSLMTRPFRPGLATSKDKNFYPLILFLIYYWCDIRHLVTKLNGKLYLEHIILDKPRMCDSLPSACVYRDQSNNTYNKNKMKFNSLQNDRMHPDNQHKVEHNHNNYEIIKNQSIQTEYNIVADKIPLTYRCCHCQMSNTVYTSIFIESNLVEHNNNCHLKLPSNNCIRNNEITSTTHNLLNIDNIPSNNFNTKDQIKISPAVKLRRNDIGWIVNNNNDDEEDTISPSSSYVPDNNASLDNSISNSCPSEVSTSTGASSSVRQTLYNKLHIKQLRSKLKFFTRKPQQMHHSNSDEFIEYTKVKYKKYFNAHCNPL